MRAVFLTLVGFILHSCGGDNFTPKPVGYFRIDLPKPSYIEKTTDCPFIFEISDRSRLEFYKESTSSQLCWFDIAYPGIKAKIHMTYKPVDGDLRNFLEEARKLAYEHQVKASSISQSIIDKEEEQVYGLLYRLGGEVASPLQFYLTDSTRHFIRGSLYFEASPNPDSIAPVLDYVGSDIAHMISSFEWK